MATELLIDPAIVAQQREVIESADAEKFIADWMTVRNAEDINGSWTPHDVCLIPNRAIDPNFRQREEAIFEEAQGLRRELVIATVFHHVTEENLPGYMRSLNVFMPDPDGTSPLPSARWQRVWTRQEKRHGQSSHGYLYLSGRVDMGELDRVIGHQIQNGFNMNARMPYDYFYYPADQERKTKMTHGRTGREAHNEGAEVLSSVCTAETKDEAVHERFYVDFFGYLFDQDPNGAMISLRDMARRKTVMPSLLIDDGRMGSTAARPKMFLKFGQVDASLGLFDFYQDTADDIGYFIRVWKVDDRQVTGEAAEAQEELHQIHQDYQQKAEAQAKKARTLTPPDLTAFDRLVPPLESLRQFYTLS